MAEEPGALTQRILLIRHAEKPTPDGVVQGVDEFGRPSADELSVLGWQRAGALAAWLAGADGSRGGLFEPRHLYAARPTSEAPSVRSVSTLQPLADVLGLSISLECAVGEEERLASMLSNIRECALVAWEHKAIVGIARHLVGPSQKLPDGWPDDRFDLAWVFEREAGPWRFRQVPQRLLAGDRTSLIE